MLNRSKGGGGSQIKFKLQLIDSQLVIKLNIVQKRNWLKLPRHNSFYSDNFAFSLTAKECVLDKNENHSSHLTLTRMSQQGNGIINEPNLKQNKKKKIKSFYSNFEAIHRILISCKNIPIFCNSLKIIKRNLSQIGSEKWKDSKHFFLLIVLCLGKTNTRIQHY